MNKATGLLVAAAVCALFASGSAQADNHEKKTEKTGTAKNGCKGAKKDSCKGHDKSACAGKDGCCGEGEKCEKSKDEKKK
ncbi:MAG: hypothetical protein IT289_00790 [Oligoflexia bacterium]|nr:hypothetical protein [Oligoflexia bacterium]